MPFIRLSKRKFLTTALKAVPAIWGGIIIWAVKNYITFRSDKPEKAIGRLTDYKENTVVHLNKERAFLVRDALGLYAMSDICTHLGCRLHHEDDILKCHCHKSIFNLKGTPVKGPAKKDLDHFYISKNRDGVLVLNTTQVVSRDFRYAE